MGNWEKHQDALDPPVYSLYNIIYAISMALSGNNYLLVNSITNSNKLLQTIYNW